MHLNAPHTACLRKETCSSKQATIPPERFAAAAIASACTASAWHRDRSLSRSLSLRRSLQGIVSQTIPLDASLCLRHSLHSMDGPIAQFILAEKLTGNRKPDHSFGRIVVLTA